MRKTYFDAYNEQWVGEHETKDAHGEISRTTEWFDTEDEAKRYSRKGY